MKPQRKRKRIIQELVFLIIVTIIIYAFLNYRMTSIYISNHTEKTPKELLSKGWNKTFYGNSGFTIETPVVLIKDTISIGEDVKNLIDQMDIYSYTDKGLKLLINTVKYKPEIASITLRDAANVSVPNPKPFCTEPFLIRNAIFRPLLGGKQEFKFKIDSLIIIGS